VMVYFETPKNAVPVKSVLFGEEQPLKNKS
jgi:hypothetical protein